jgi:hypothetical protein
MRRIKLVLSALAVVVASFAAFVGPVMADDLNCRDARGDLIRCDGQFFAPVNNFNDSFFFTPFFFGDDDFANCPFLGDTSGIVNEFDCFD